MKKALFVDCCLRKGSNTKKLADAFLEELKDYDIKHLILEDENLQPLVGEFFEERQKLLDEGNRDHPRFKYAHEFAQADLIIVAAPFWDLCFPALLKIYIENISVDGITFDSTAFGLTGLCKANNLVYLTTRGGIYENNDSELAIPIFREMCKFFGIKHFDYVAADGMNVEGFDAESSLENAKQKARELARTL